MFGIAATLALVICVRGDGLVSHWSFDTLENGITTEPVYGLDATVFGAQLNQGALHGGLYFDGTDDYASVASMASVQQTIGSLNVGTISAWFRFDHIPAFAEVLDIFYFGDQNDYSAYGPAADCYELEIGHFSSQSRLYWTHIKIDDAGDSHIPLCWSTSENLGKERWYHIVSATSYSGTTVYLDDVEIYQGSNLTWQFGDETKRRFLGDVQRQEVLWFGKGLWNFEHQYFDGMIDEIKVWNRALTAVEVHEEYERAAGVGSLSIDSAIPQEVAIANDGVVLWGTLDNIVNVQWQIDEGPWLGQPSTSLNPTWEVTLENSFSPGRHELKVRGRNAAGRSYADTRVLIQADLNSDGNVNIHDLLNLIGAWGDCTCSEDLSGNGKVDVADVLIMISAWS